MGKHRYKPQDYSYGVIPYCVIDAQISYLLIQHRAGHWAFSKGHMDQGESKMETALRELQEETGIAADDIILDEQEVWYTEAYKFVYRGSKVRKTVQYILGQCSSQLDINIQHTELSDSKWCSYDQAIDLISFEAGRQLLSLVNKSLTHEETE